MERCGVHRTENRLRNLRTVEGSRLVHVDLESVKVGKWIHGSAVGIGTRSFPIQGSRGESGSSARKGSVAGKRSAAGIRGAGAAASPTAGEGRQHDDHCNNDDSSNRCAQSLPPSADAKEQLAYRKKTLLKSYGYEITRQSGISIPKSISPFCNHQRP